MEKTMLVSGVTLSDWKELLLHAGNELKKQRKGQYRAELKALILRINLAIGTSLVEKRFCDTLDVHHHDGILTVRGINARLFRNLLTQAHLGVMASIPDIHSPEWWTTPLDITEYHRLNNLLKLVRYLERLMSDRIKDTYPPEGTPCLKDRIRHRVQKLQEEKRESELIERILADALTAALDTLEAKCDSPESGSSDSGG
jgi:hypothetical protein